MITWQEVQNKARTPGSVVLKQWMAQREATRIQNATHRLTDGTRGSELYSWLVDGLSSAGKPVNEKTALSVSAVYACVGIIGGAIASMPFHIYKRTEDGRERTTHDLWWFFNESPHPAWTASAFWEYIAQSRLFHGDAFARIHRASRLSPKIVSIEPLHPSAVTVEQIDGLLRYTIINADAKPVTIDQGDMLHIPGIGFDGQRSISVLRHALRTSAGTALAADEYSASFFANSARPDFILTTDEKMSPDTINDLRSQWQEKYGGSARSHLPAVLQGGMKAQQLTMNSEDAQLLATRQFQVEDICRIFGVPPFMVGHQEKTSSWGSGVEQMSIGFVKYTLQRHLRPIEQEINRKIWPRSAGYFAEFNTAGLERGDLKTRYEAYRVAIGRAGEPGFMTVNEARRIENMKPIPGGDQLHTGTNDGQNATATGAE